MAIMGYYLVVESSQILSKESPKEINNLVEYYNELIYQNLENQLNNNSFNGLDFYILNNQLFSKYSFIDSTIMFQIKNHSEKNFRGFIDLDSATIQYVRVISDTNDITGGIIHLPGFKTLLNETQNRVRSGSFYSEIKLSYITFTGVIYLFLSIMTGILAYLFSVKYSRNLSGPISALTKSSQAIALGDFKQYIPVQSKDEIGQLIENFNKMAAQLDNTTNRLAQSERVAAWRNIARRFAHELKNPLQPISISIYQIEAKLKDTPQYENLKELIQAAGNELKYLTLLAERFSNLAKLPPPKKENINLTELLRNFVKLYDDENNYHIKLILPEQDIYIQLDQTYFREILHNLVKNGIEASPDNSCIEIHLDVQNGFAKLIVRDFGKGMSQEVLNSARIPYFTTRTKGNGLGLAIVEKIITESDGQLIIESTPDKGTDIIILLPMEK